MGINKALLLIGCEKSEVRTSWRKWFTVDTSVVCDFGFFLCLPFSALCDFATMRLYQSQQDKVN